MLGDYWKGQRTCINISDGLELGEENNFFNLSVESKSTSLSLVFGKKKNLLRFGEWKEQ